MIRLDEELKAVKNVGIGGHIRPDGDCVGSCMGLYYYIREQFPDISVQVYLEPIPEVFRFLEETQVIQNELTGEAPELFFALDCGDKDRLGMFAKLFDGAGKTICIDHHISNTGFADESLVVGEGSSTCEILVSLIPEEKISKRMAEAFYMGMVHDTGIFQYTCTSPMTMRRAAVLMEKGINFTEIVDATFTRKTFAQKKMTAAVLSNCRLILDGTCIVGVLTREMAAGFGLTCRDGDGIVAEMRSTTGVLAAALLTEVGDDSYKVSLRSNSDSMNVSRIAVSFGGGGHVRASGFSMQGTAEEILERLTGKILEEKENML